MRAHVAMIALALLVEAVVWRQGSTLALLRRHQSVWVDLACFGVFAFGGTTVVFAVFVVASGGATVWLQDLPRAVPLRLHLATGSILLDVLLFHAADGLAWYGLHRALHTRWLWWAHAFHHASSPLTALTNFRLHPFEVALRSAQLLLVYLVLGVSPQAAGLYGAWTLGLNVLAHAAPDWSFGPMWWLYQSPRFHRRHHARDSVNFSMFPWIDRAFGTLDLGREP